MKTEEENTPSARRQHAAWRRWMLPAMVGGLIALGSLGLGDVYCHRLLPQDTWLTSESASWQALNVNRFPFKSPKDFEAAEAALRKNLSRKSTDPFIARYLLAGLLAMEGKDSDALQEYDALFERRENQATANWLYQTAYQPYLDEAHAAAGIIYYKQNNYDMALQQLQEIRNMDALAQSDLVSALKDCLSEPGRADFHWRLGNELLADYRLVEARREISQVTEMSSNPRLRIEAGSLLKTHFPQKSTGSLPIARYFSLRGDALDSEESPEAVIATWKTLIRNTPDSGWGYFRLALAYRDQDETRLAESNIHKAMALSPNSYHVFVTAGDIALDEERYPEAIRRYQQAQHLVLTYPDDHNQALLGNIDNQIGFAYESMNQLAEARQHYQRALTISGESDTENEYNNADYDYAQDALARLNESK